MKLKHWFMGIFLSAFLNAAEWPQSIKAIFRMSNRSDILDLSIKYNDIVHTLPRAIPTGGGMEVQFAEFPVNLTLEDNFYKAPLILGWYDFKTDDDFVRPICVENIIISLTKNQMQELQQKNMLLDLQVDTGLLWKVLFTLGRGTCFGLKSDTLSTFSSLNYSEHSQLSRDQYTYARKVQ